MSQVKEIDLAQMAPLRDVSQKISQYLQETLSGYLSPLAPLLAPNRVLGEHLQGYSRDRLPDADKNFAQLEERYVRLCQHHFRLPSKIRSPVSSIKTTLDVHPWEYLYEVGDRTIIISSPVKWVLSYEFTYGLSNLLRAKLAGEKPQPDETKQMLVNTLTLWMMMERSRGIKKILGDLRFPVSVATSPVSGDLPYIVLTAATEAFRPQDDLINTVIQLSGRPAFEELVDPEAVAGIKDPMVEKITELTSG